MEIVFRYLDGVPLISIYTFEINGVKIAVDPGPASLHEPLDVDVVLCTHLHLDHCGSAGFYKRVYVHEKYTKHLEDPTALFQASVAVLGTYAKRFGPPPPAGDVRPVSDNQRLFDGIDAIHTPGHAPHHVMYLYRDTKTLFVGDGAGVYIPELKVIIPTTPPVFRLDLYLTSLERVKGLGVEELCFPHYTCTREVDLLDIHRGQVETWVEVLRDVETVEEGLARLRRSDENAAKVLDAGGLYLDFYLKFSVLGFLEYIRENVRL